MNGHRSDGDDPDSTQLLERAVELENSDDVNASRRVVEARQRQGSSGGGPLALDAVGRDVLEFDGQRLRNANAGDGKSQRRESRPAKYVWK